MKVTIPNACAIVAIGKLLDNPHWTPRELAEIILAHNGLPSEDTKILEQYAPVRVWDEKSDIYGDDEYITIPSGDGREFIVVKADDKIVVSYQTKPGRAHMLCIPARHIFRFKKTIMCVITKRHIQKQQLADEEGARRIFEESKRSARMDAYHAGDEN